MVGVGAEMVGSVSVPELPGFECRRCTPVVVSSPIPFFQGTFTEPLCRIHHLLAVRRYWKQQAMDYLWKHP